jgi:hypothetical protein
MLFFTRLQQLGIRRDITTMSFNVSCQTITELSVDFWIRKTLAPPATYTNRRDVAAMSFNVSHQTVTELSVDFWIRKTLAPPATYTNM